MAAWKMLEPFTRKSTGLPSSSDEEKWVPGVTLLPRNDLATTSAAVHKTDFLTPAAEPTVWEATFFNDVAATFVNTEPKLNVWETTDVLVRERLTRGIEFPRGAKAVKTFWYRLDDKVPVRVWDWRKIPKGVTEAPLASLRAACVEREVKTPGCLKAADSFDTATLESGDGANFSCPSGCKENVKAGDLMILVGMHIVAKETPEWMWATYWWRDAEAAIGQPWPTGESWTCVDAQRHEAIGSLTPPWSNYSMDVTISFKRPKPAVDANELCGEPGMLGGGEQRIAMYNPFVEARLKHGLKSSCVHCHAVASTDTYQQFPGVPAVGYEMPGHSLRDFEEHLRLDYVWSVKRSVKPTSFDD